MAGTDVSAALSNSLSLSSILVLTALGLAITFGVMRVINMAHGEMLMLGAYTAFAVEDPQAIPILIRNLGRLTGLDLHLAQGLHLNLFWAIPIAFLVTGLVGYFLEVGLIRFLYGRPLDTLLATWGVALILQQAVKFLFGPDLKPLSVPHVLEHSWEIGGLTFPIYRVFIVAV